MRILVVGSGGREHALVWALHKTATGANDIFCAPGNDGINQIARTVKIEATDVRALADFAEAERLDLTVVGGEAPLAVGIADEFANRKLRIAAPNKQAAQLETSKAFAKDFMQRHKVPTAAFQVVDSVDAAHNVLSSGRFGDADSPVVVKADGLAAGKGVVVADSHAEAKRAVQEIMSGTVISTEAGRRVVLEERLTGLEVSLLLWTDGRDYKLMPAARDHKRIGEGDTGPNTGGMGAVTGNHILDDDTLQRIRREIVEPTLDGIKRDELSFRGVLFIGLMLTPAGPRVLEYNTRFGDPEAQTILVRLRSDLAAIFSTVAEGRLSETKIEWSPDASACVVLAAPGYPQQPVTGATIKGLDAGDEISDQVDIFHAGTRRAPDGSWQTAGGRVLGITATATTLDDALDRCYRRIDCISWHGMQYRRDIGRDEG